MIKYDKTKPPFPDAKDADVWSDFCDCMNKEGIYANQDPNKLMYCKSYYFIQDGESPDIETIGGAEINEDTGKIIEYFQEKLYLESKIPSDRFSETQKQSWIKKIINKWKNIFF